ncbi:MAG: polysaccharide deacetylase family protein [Pirellulaceae bacterium]|nr:polysaccharide deacetylase family protein [Pirellulaceae bacterium]
MKTSTKPLLNISLDLDNKWSYLKTAGRPAWKEFPSYLPEACQHIVQLLQAANIHATMFVVGQDLLNPQDLQAVRSLTRAGHDLGNHSFHHEPWLHLYDREKIAYELDKTDELLAQVGDCHSLGFRGPGYSDSPLVHEMLCERGYRYCASQLSSCLGPMARAYYFLRTGLKREQRRGREKLFGSFNAVLGRNDPYRLPVGTPQLWMIPVTVMPIFRTPFHFSYLQYVAEKSPALARFYLSWSLRLCRICHTQPSMLLHPLDFMGGDEQPDLAFFPGMKPTGAAKRERLSGFLSQITRHFEVQTLGQAAAKLDGREYSRLCEPININSDSTSTACIVNT